MVVWAFFGIAFLRDCNENWFFSLRWSGKRWLRSTGVANSWEEIPYVQGQEPRLHFTWPAVWRYPTSKVRKTPVRRRHWSGCDEIPHVQGQRRSPIKMVKVKVMSLSRVRLFVTPWTVAHQAPPSMGLSRQEYWSGLPLPSPGDLPNPGIEPRSPPL